MSLFSKKFKDERRKLINIPKKSKPKTSNLLKQIAADMRFAGSDRTGGGLGGMISRVKDKVPLAPVFAGMPKTKMVGEPVMFPQPIPRVPIEENISEISGPKFAMSDAEIEMMEPRMAMANGDAANITDFLNASPQMRLSGIQARLGELQREFDDAQINGDSARATMLNEQINQTIKELVEVEAMIGDMQRQADMKMADGGEAESTFPDLSGDGKTTFKDVLIGRGVKLAEGDEVSMMMMEMEEPAGEAEDVMAEVADVAPAAQALDQYVNMVVEMIQAGASEAEIIQMLVEAGLDEADINAVFQAVLEAMQGPSIDSELAALG